MEAACPLAPYDEDLATDAADETSPALTLGEFELRTMPEGVSLAAELARAFPDPERVVIGLTELLINAVEHGNLGITYEEKSALLDGGDLGREIERRSSRPDLAARRVKVTLRRATDRVTATIEDEGSGFDWRAFLDYDPARALDPNGRGIAIARATSFDNLAYNERGNVVTAEVHTGPASGARSTRRGSGGEPVEAPPALSARRPSSPATSGAEGEPGDDRLGANDPCPLRR